MTAGTATLAVLVAVLVAIVIYHDHVVAGLEKALDIQARATSREHARAEILASELEHVRGELAHLQVAAPIVTLWRSLRVGRTS